MTATVTVKQTNHDWMWRLWVNERCEAHGISASYESAWQDGIAALTFHRGAKVVESESHYPGSDDHSSSVGAPD